MSEEENPLNPILALTHLISDTGIYTYYLSTQVPGMCIDLGSEEVISDPDVVEEIALLAGYTLVPGEVNMAVTYSAISCAHPSAVLENETIITINPDGKKGSIIVIIASDPASLIVDNEPQTSGKAIIQFTMSQKENPLKPKLDLTYSISGGIYTYCLTTQVSDRCINTTTENCGLNPLYEVNQFRVNDLVSFDLLNARETCDNQIVMTEIKNNPTGLPGEILVKIKEFLISNHGDGHGPEPDGRAIIRFEKAKFI